MRTLSASLVLSLLLPLSAFAADDSKLLSVDTSKDHIRGERDAAASMIVYSDFQCPFCKRFHPVTEQIREKYPKLRIVYRNFPLSFHPFARPAAKAAECVAREKGNDAYWAFIDSIFEAEELSTASIKKLALAQDIGDSMYDTCVADATINNRIEDDIESGRLAGVNGTPTSFLINEEGTAFKIVGSVPFDTFDKRLKTFTFTDKKSYDDTKVKTTKRKPRVRATQSGVRRWK